MADERAVSGLPGERPYAGARPSRQGDSPWREDAHAVVIGIDAYQDPRIPDLRFARSDAEAVYRVLTDPGVGRFNPENVTLLVDADATERKIRSALGTRLPQRAARTSTVCIYYAGHGAPVVELDASRRSADSIEKYLVPHDADADDLRSSAISMDSIQQFFSWIDAKQVICFLDSCYSGAAGGRTLERDSVQMRAWLSDEYLDALASEGRVVITACATNEVALESPLKGHGLFTYHLVRGLQGRADADGDGRVSVDELYDYVYTRVARDARLMQGRMNPIRKGTVRGRVYLTEYRRTATSDTDAAVSAASAVVPIAHGVATIAATKRRSPDWRLIAAISLAGLLVGVSAVWLWTPSDRNRVATVQGSNVTTTPPRPQPTPSTTLPSPTRGGEVVIAPKKDEDPRPSTGSNAGKTVTNPNPATGQGTTPASNTTTDTNITKPPAPIPARVPFTPTRWGLPDTDLLGFADIPAGDVLMGSDRSIDANARPDELPQHMVTLPSFLIGRYEVTVGQYLVCVEEGACRRPELASPNESEFMPVRLVSWTDATAYSAWLDRQLRSWSGAPSGLAAILRGVRGGGDWHVRLPTEAEWERAARGSQGRVYPWGNEKPDGTRANYDATHIGAPTPVGRFPKGASEFGLFDMSGNVWEWTHSRAVKYPYRAADGREDDKVASYIHRVARGGSFQTPDVRAAERNPREPEERKNFIGFRVAIGPPLRSAR